MRYPKRSQYKYAKSRYQVRNWAKYEVGLQMRGALTVWLSDAALEAWRAPAIGRAGGQPIYSDLAIEAARTIRFRLQAMHQRRSAGDGSKRGKAGPLPTPGRLDHRRRAGSGVDFHTDAPTSQECRRS